MILKHNREHNLMHLKPHSSLRSFDVSISTEAHNSIHYSKMIHGIAEHSNESQTQIPGGCDEKSQHATRGNGIIMLLRKKN
jgi:hypothetical protein